MDLFSRRIVSMLLGLGTGYLMAALLFGCVSIDVLVEKNLYVENSENVGVDYTTTSDIDAELKQDLKDLLDLEIPFR